ncbi:hypothetical protein DXT99_24715 [Pontibacter diazotrophicus]|uniref:Uncharacterized protein n=1 Tax=Pontibacter diazotrophicus TaxID=1400979 RepID=A0A3D8L276_9BACT|nr:hypothetical protein [Pontibacter diazotrophicus]RDV11465.1 hypothetical protein DXT99_24715 [Pontibacter diazotrophicus]
MNLYQFNYCDLSRRAELVWQNGNYLSVRHDGGYSVVLYHMGEFFAEVWYSPEDNQVKNVRGFKSKACLEPYLETVSLQELMGKK